MWHVAYAFYWKSEEQIWRKQYRQKVDAVKLARAGLRLVARCSRLFTSSMNASDLLQLGERGVLGPQIRSSSEGMCHDDGRRIRRSQRHTDGILPRGLVRIFRVGKRNDCHGYPFSLHSSLKPGEPIRIR